MMFADKFSYRKPMSFSEFSYLRRLYPALEYHSNSTPFSVKRTLRGSSQAWGQLSVVITNQCDAAVYVLYLETMPWLVQFYIHTLEARVDGVIKGPS